MTAEGAIEIAKKLLASEAKFKDLESTLNLKNPDGLDFLLSDRYPTEDEDFVFRYRNARIALISYLQQTDASHIQVEDPRLRQFIQSLADSAVNRLEQEGEFEGLSVNEQEQLFNDRFYDWISGREFVEDFQRVRPLLILSDIPGPLRHLIHQARMCFGFRQYDAVVVLSRMIIEVSITDVGLRSGVIAPSQDLYADYPPKDRRDAVLSPGSPAWKCFKALYRECSEIIHGAGDEVDKGGALRLLKEAMELAEQVYVVNHRRLT